MITIDNSASIANGNRMTGGMSNPAFSYAFKDGAPRGSLESSHVNQPEQQLQRFTQ